MNSKKIILNILAELSECGKTTDLEEYYSRIFKEMLRCMKSDIFCHDCGWERDKEYINIKDFKTIFELG